MNSLLKNAQTVLPNREIKFCSTVLANGIISEISEDNGNKADFDEIVNLQGAHLFAGFIDVHNHGAIGVDCNSADADALHKVSEFLAKNGVTGWLPTLVPDSIENYQQSIHAIDELMRTQREREPAARVLGVHYEGPFVSEKQCGALRTRYFKDFSNGDELQFLPKLKSPAAQHLITLAPEIAGGIALIKELKRQSWIISIGHTRASIETLDAACAAGARHLTHFFNAMTSLHHRDIGVVGWGLVNDNVTFDIIADGIHVAPQILKFACRAKSSDKVTLVSDSIAPTGLGDGQFEVWGEQISVLAGKTQNQRGSIAGSVITVLDAMKKMLALGFSPSEVSQMTSLNPAKLLGIENETGTITANKRADLTAIDQNGYVILTIVGGRVAYSKK